MEREARREQLLNALSENEAFLVLVMIRAGFGLILMVGSAVGFLVSPSYVMALGAMCGENHANILCADLDISRGFTMTLLILSGLTTMLVSFLAVRTLRTAMAGYRRYRTKKGLPKLY